MKQLIINPFITTLIILYMAFSCGTVMAQENVDTVSFGRTEVAVAADSLNLPPLNMLGQMPLMGSLYGSPLGFGPSYLGVYPLAWGWGWDNWQLHEGLNVSLGASVFAAFGKHAPHGAGFTQSVSLMHAMPLTDKLSLAVGGYLGNVSWQHASRRDAGLSAVLGYKFDEHWEAFLYGQKSLVKNRPMPWMYDLGELGDRIGAAVKYNFSSSFSVQVSVEADRR